MLHFKSVWYTFQYLKERVTEANVLFETFNSKQIDKTSIAEILDYK